MVVKYSESLYIGLHQKLMREPIIDQRAIRKLDNDTLEEITTRVRGLEHHLYPQVIKSL